MKWLIAIILVLIVLFFCAWMCGHYWLFHYRGGWYLPDQATEIGIIASFFAVLVTLLVAWNIGSTINAKDEIANAKAEVEKYKNQLDEKVNMELAKFTEQLNLIKTSKDEIFTSAKNAEAMSLFLKGENTKSYAEKADIPLLYEEAYEYFVKSAEAYFEAKSYSKLQNCYEQIWWCLHEINDKNKDISEETVKYANSVYEKFLQSDNVSSRLKRKLESLMGLQNSMTTTDFYKRMLKLSNAIIRPVQSNDKTDDNDSTQENK